MKRYNVVGRGIPGNMSIADLVDALGTLNDPNAARPMALLRPYMHGGLWEGFFDRPEGLCWVRRSTLDNGSTLTSPPCGRKIEALFILSWPGSYIT